jgi:hypothetical protein
MKKFVIKKINNQEETYLCYDTVGYVDFSEKYWEAVFYTSIEAAKETCKINYLIDEQNIEYHIKEVEVRVSLSKNQDNA